jgi:cell division protein FtsB
MPRRRLRSARRGSAKPLWERVSRRTLYIAGGLLLAALLLGNKGFRTLVSSALHLRRLESQVAEAEAEEARLKAAIEAVKNDDLALESAVRRELGYQRPGEVEYRFPPPAPEK